MSDTSNQSSSRPNFKEMSTLSNERPSTAQRWFKQLEDDEDLAKTIALDEDSKIAAKY